MKRNLKKILLGTASVPCLAVLALVAGAQWGWDRTFEAPYPDLRASTDSTVIARGRYLVHGPAHCAYCHTTLGIAGVEAATEPPLTGGYAFDLPIGTFYTPNLTPDPETGIGRRTDGELARMLRYGVRPDGRAAISIMEFHHLSDADVVAVLSYLRARPPVRNEVPQRDLNLMGKALFAFVIEPTGPERTPPRESPPSEPTVERGRYLANDVAACVGCHTDRSLQDGSYVGPRFAGGFHLEDPTDPSKVFVTPNLTPDPRTGHITSWSEEQFVARFRAGRVHAGSEMPWGVFSRMTENDLRALYRYLRSLPPVEKDTGPLVQVKPAG